MEQPAKRRKVASKEKLVVYGPKDRKRSKKRHSVMPTSVRVKGKPGFPDMFVTTLDYVSNGTFAGGVPTPTAQVFLANSLYDPDSTGTGHQPKYYDQLIAVYGKYLVYGCKYELEVNNGATTGAYGVVTFTETDVSSRTVEALAEGRYGKTFNLGPLTGNGTKTIKGYMSMAKLMGQPDLDSDNTQYSVTSSSPADGAFLIIKVASVDGVSNANVYWRIKITYYCKFKELLDPSQS